MVQANYPYLDLTVLPEIRPHVLAPNAAALFDETLERVLWANGEGTRLVGAPSIRELLEDEVQLNKAMMRQISSVARKLTNNEDAAAFMRVPLNFKTRLIGFTLRRIELPNGETAVLLLTESLHGRRHTLQDMARVAVDCLDGYSNSSAILDENGKIFAASEHFHLLDVADDELEALAREVSTETDRLVKRPIETNNGLMPAGIARLSDNPAAHILIITNANSAIDVSDETKTNEPAADPAASNNSDQDSSNAGPMVGAFSNRRNPIGKPASKWYFKSLIDPDAEDFAEEENPVSDQTLNVQETPSTPSGSKEADNTAQSTNKGVTKRPSALIQDVEHTPITSRTSASLVPDFGQSDNGQRIDDLQEDEPDDGFRFTSGSKPIRFVWELTADNEFRSVSSELASAVGKKSANIEGLTWEEVGQLFKIENADEISELLKKGDTWSGKTVSWPVDNTDLRVPIDLAGLPSYDRNRSFAGFNGFGIVRTADAIIDPDIDDRIASKEASEDDTTLGATTEANSEPELPSDSDGEAEKPSPSASETEFQEFAGFNGLGVIGTANAETDISETDSEPSEQTKRPSIIDGESKRDTSKTDRTLSSDEQETFEEIREKLTDESTNSNENDNQEAFEADGAEDRNSNIGFLTANLAKATSKEKKSPSEVENAKNVKDQASLHNKPKSNIPDHAVDTSILARLPIPVLVYRDNDLLFGNEEFFQLTGYETLYTLAEAGGIEALFGSTQASPENTQAQIFHQNGNKLDVHAHLQRVPWDADRAMLLTLRQDEGNRNDRSPSLENVVTSPPLSSGLKSDNGPNSSANAIAAKPKQASVTQLRPVSTNTKSQPAPQTDAFGGIDPEDLRSILDTATDGVIILSDEGVVRAINQSAEALFDIDPTEIVDQNLTKLLAPESHRSALDYVSGIAGTGVESILNDGREVIGKTARGGLIPLFMTIGKMDKTDACCVVVRDITQWKKNEEELVTARSKAEIANAQKTEFLTKVSHEIRTPLNAIIGFSNLMISERFGKIDNDRYRGYLRDINHSGTHMLDLINDLLDISKIEAGKMDLKFDACELGTIVSETVALTQPEANKERVIIRTSLSSAVPKVVADPRSLKQIILNLVSNSIKHTKSGGQVIISTVYEEGGEVALRVRDTGVGMSELELAKALQPFQQVGDDSDETKQGTGLGLPLTKAMVEANRAKFHIESKPEEGTLVEIRFPPQRVLADR